MPMIDLKLSQGAVSEQALAPLAEELTTLLLRHRGAPDTEERRRKVWIYVHELPALIGGAPAQTVDAAHVTVEFTLLEGSLDQAARAALADDAARAVRDAAAPVHVWTLFREVPAADWAVEGRLLGPAPA